MIATHRSLAKLLAEVDLHPQTEWLTESELSELATWRDSLRSRQWLAGRWLAKRQLMPLVNAARLNIDIASRDSFGRTTAPRVTVHGRSWLGSLSISHAGDHVAVAIESQPDRRVGIDVVAFESHDFNSKPLEFWFSPIEQNWIRQTGNGSRRAAQLWAIKEAAYKASQRGEAFAPADWPALPWLTSEKLAVSNLDDAVIVAL